VDIFLIFSKGFGQLTRPADGVGTFDPRASKPSVRRAENGRKIAISGKTVQSAKSGIKANQWVSILIDLPPAQNWKDDEYAEAVICGRENRFSADQVRLIRFLHAEGRTVSQISVEIECFDVPRLNWVIMRRTYSRVRN
jgi:hypothetical protein